MVHHMGLIYAEWYLVLVKCAFAISVALDVTPQWAQMAKMHVGRLCALCRCR
jgi:hypothetical protein